MSYLLIPHDVSATQATLWMAAHGAASHTDRLELAPGVSAEYAYGDWGQWPPAGGPARLRYRQARVTGLQPGRDYNFSLLANGQAVAEARLKTLPDQLPSSDGKPFTVMLGSCFSVLEDQGGKVGNTWFHMPYGSRPDVKILAGDQVYLDSPWYYFAFNTHNAEELGSIFLSTYTNTWGQNPGFNQLLTNGANYFTCDDHEFWNNAPNRAAYVLDTWPLVGNREAWLELASQLFRVFQAPQAISGFSVPPISFLVVDSRITRSADRTRFMRDEDMDVIARWVEGLQGPGVLVLGQPILAAPTSLLKGHFGDWNLPDFDQYHDLVRILGKSRHDLVILTGDVHYGRIAWCTLSSGHDLIEIISSPMSLVDEKARGVWNEAPVLFPAAAGTEASGLAPVRVETEKTFGPTDGHFLTLEFTRRGAGATMGVRVWPVFHGGVPPSGSGRKVWQRNLR